jgi:hypothetical protein
VATLIIGTWLRTIISVVLCLHFGLAFAEAEYKIVTANERGTYFAIGADLAKYVAPDAGISLEVPNTSRPKRTSRWRSCRPTARPQTSSICAMTPASNSR